MRSILILFLVLFSGFSFGQTEKYDSILKIENLTLNNFELRVYKDYSTSTGLEMFRFYNENDIWKIEFYETIARKINDEIKIRIRKEKLNTFKNTELIWLEFLNTNILYLPDWDKIEYKLKPEQNKYEIIDGEIVSETTSSVILDGVSYFVLVKSGENVNHFKYNNPLSYLKLYPDVDELISFKKLLNLISEEFDKFSSD